jgi:hypothetical protein
MNHIAFVAAAYSVAIGLSAGLIAWAWLSMRRAEHALKKLRGRGD